LGRIQEGAKPVTEETSRTAGGRVGFDGFAAAIYAVAFVTGAIVMSFEMLGSRYLNPYFGSGIYTWASLISTVLAALTVGYFLGGSLADRRPAAPVLALTVLVGSVYLLLLPLFAQAVLEWVLAGFDDVRSGSLTAAMAIMFLPVALLGMYSPFAIRLLLRSAHRSGMVSGTVYGISTAGSIVGTLGTTFFLIPAMGSRAITLALGTAGVAAALVLMVARPGVRGARGLGAALIGTCLMLSSAHMSQADELLDAQVRADMLAHKDGAIAHLETEYNDIYISKQRAELTMSFQLKGWDYTESITNLKDPDDLPLKYTHSMTLGVIYPPQVERVLMLGLGGGTISTYLGRHMPQLAIDVVEIDPAVVSAAKKYFGIRETDKVRYLEGDARVFLNRHKEPYDLVLVDAFHGGYVPFHLLTKEFYALLKQRLTGGGAAAFNVHDGTKLYASTVLTLGAVFGDVHLYPSGEGEVIAIVTAGPAPAADALAARAAALQDSHKFRFPLPQLLARRSDKKPAQKGELLTDDFAPVNLYDTIGDRKNRKK
jgi:spermidine synthase